MCFSLATRGHEYFQSISTGTCELFFASQVQDCLQQEVRDWGFLNQGNNQLANSLTYWPDSSEIIRNMAVQLVVCSCWLSNVNLVILFVWNLGEKIFRSCNNNCKFWFKNPCEFCRRTTPVIQIQIHYCCKSSMRHSNTTFYLKVILQ